MNEATSRPQPSRFRSDAQDELPLEPDFRRRFDFQASRFQLTLALGGLPLLMRTDREDIARFLESEFSSFLVDEPPLATIDLRREDEFPFHTLVGRLVSYREGDFLAAKFRGMAACVDASSRWARGWLRDEHYKQDLSNIIRFVMGAITPGLRALMFHTAALGRDGRAYMFFGPSTAGKSTIVGLSRDKEVLTDDMLIVRQGPSGWLAASCGFWGGETTQYPSKRVELPIAAFFRLRKGEHNRLVPLSHSRMAFEVLCNVPAVERSREEHEHLLELASAATREVPGYELHFHNRDASFWSAIDECLD